MSVSVLPLQPIQAVNQPLQIAINNSSRESVAKYVLEEVSAHRRALLRFEENVTRDFSSLVDLVFLVGTCQGHVITTGMGKAGFVAQKLAATLSSTGTPAFFVHPAEALHGDAGAVTSKDLLIAISSSGETDEVMAFASQAKSHRATVVAITGDASSSLARISPHTVVVSPSVESDPFSCVPSCSTTVLFAAIDAVAIAVMRSKGTSEQDLASLHPGGMIGRRLSWCVSDVMRQGNSVPLVGIDANVRDATLEMTRKCLGATFIVDANSLLAGVFTDGDLRRLISRTADPLQIAVADAMTSPARSISAREVAGTALKLMEESAITVLPVLDDSGVVIGAIHLHDLVQAGFR